MDDPKLKIFREGSEVCISLHVVMAGPTFTWRWNAGTEWAATLLLRAIREQLGDGMTEARAEAYAEGWRDAKAKRAKQQWFSGRLP